MQASGETNGEKALQIIFEESFLRFLKDDRALILKDAHEQSLCSRLAAALEANARANGFDAYRADAEYNRNFGEVKTILDDDLREIPITCDVILHSRGEIRTRDNLIAIEMKKASAPEARKDSDRMRLRALTKPSNEVYPLAGANPKYVRGYELGCFLDIDRHAETALVEIYRGGAFVESFTQKFDGTVEAHTQR